MKYYLYRTENLVNGNYYIGVHGSEDPENDLYFGSGTLINRAVQKYGQSNFKTEILEYFSTWEEALAREREVVSESLLKDPQCYNLIEGGTGMCKNPSYLQSPEGNIVRVAPTKVAYLQSKGYLAVRFVRMHRGTQEIVRPKGDVDTYLKQGWSLGPTENHAKKISIKARGRIHSQESKDRISKALRGRKCSEEHRKHNSEAKRGKPNLKLRGRVVSEETRKKLSESIKKAFRENPELKKKPRGRVYVNNGEIAKRVWPAELESYISDGWTRGNFRYCWIVNEEGLRKKVREKDLQKYLDSGWTLGRGEAFIRKFTEGMKGKTNAGKVRIKKDGVGKIVAKSELQNYLDEGWILGIARKTV